MGGYELLPYVVPADSMVYQRVAQQAEPSYYPGLEGVIDNAMISGMTTAQSFSFQLTEGMLLQDLHVTAEIKEQSAGVDNIASSMLIAVIPDIVEGHEELSKSSLSDDHFRVFPIPANDFVKCSLQLDRPTKASLEICAIDGKILSRHDFGMVSNNPQISLPIYFLPEGVYILRVITDASIYSKRFIKAIH